MYGVAGERRLTEWEVPWLPGYEDSRPVRIGNAAHGQLQLDVFGEVMDTLHQGRRGGLPASESGWDVQIALLDHLAEIWREPGPRHLGSAQRAACTSPIPRRWPGSRSTARSRAPRCSACRADVERWRELCARDPRRRLPQWLERGAQQLRALLRLAGSRRQPAAARADRLPQAGRSALSRHRRGDRARSRRRRAGAALRLARKPRTACRRAKARSSPAASGSPTPICCSAAATTPSGCSAAWSALCNDVGLLARNMTRAPSASSGIFRRPSRMSR